MSHEMYDPYTTEEIMELEKRIDDLEVEKNQLSEGIHGLLDLLQEKNVLSPNDVHDFKLGLPKI